MKELIEMIEAKNKGKLLAVKPFSSHPDDHYLHIVLIERDHDYDPYVVWRFNSQDGGFFAGYYHSTMKEALETFNKVGTK